MVLSAEHPVPEKVQWQHDGNDEPPSSTAPSPPPHPTNHTTSHTQRPMNRLYPDQICDRRKNLGRSALWPTAQHDPEREHAQRQRTFGSAADRAATRCAG